MSKRNKTVLGRMFDIVCCLNTIIKTCEKGESTNLTGFQGSSFRADPCRAEGIGLVVDTTYYHDGQGELPTIGDTIYSDAAGTMPFDSSTLPAFDTVPANQGNGVLMSDSNSFVTGEEGVSQPFTCI